MNPIRRMLETDGGKPPRHPSNGPFHTCLMICGKTRVVNRHGYKIYDYTHASKAREACDRMNDEHCRYLLTRKE